MSSAVIFFFCLLCTAMNRKRVIATLVRENVRERTQGLARENSEFVFTREGKLRTLG